MNQRARRRFATEGLFVLAAGAALLSGCGGKKAATGNVVQMRDMEVVDGTTNDSMTDLDAVSTNGIGLGNSSGNSASPSRKATAAPEANAKDVEAVPNE